MEQQHGVKDGQYLCRRVDMNKATFKVEIEKGRTTNAQYLDVWEEQRINFGCTDILLGNILKKI